MYYSWGSSVIWKEIGLLVKYSANSRTTTKKVVKGSIIDAAKNEEKIESCKILN